MSEAEPTSSLLRCPECGDEVRCGKRLGEEPCWCSELPRIEPDPALPAGACLCERCLRRKIEDQRA